MNFLRAIVASLLSLACTLAVGAFVTLATLQTTLLNRQEVKAWLTNSGVYNKIVHTTISANQTVQDQLSSVNSSAISQNTAETALDQTFSANYLKQQGDKIIDSSFDWLDGKQPTINFNIDTTGQKNAFISNLANTLGTKLANLPQCASLNDFDSSNPTCLPPGTNATQLAQSLATDAGNNLGIFKQPITNQSLAQANSEAGQSNTNSPLASSKSGAQVLPSITANLHQWLILLPIITVVCGALSVLLSRDRLKAAKLVSRRLTFGLAITFIVGLGVAFVGRNLKLSDLMNGNAAILTNIVEPIIRQAAPAIGDRLALVSGICGLITLAGWVTFQTLWENQEKTKLLTTETAPSVAVNTKSDTVAPKPASDTKSATPSGKEKNKPTAG